MVSGNIRETQSKKLCILKKFFFALHSPVRKPTFLNSQLGWDAYIQTLSIISGLLCLFILTLPKSLGKRETK